MNKTEDNCIRELDFKELIFKILYQWRVILLFALTFAILLGGYRFISINSIYTKDVVEEQKASYKEQVSTYELNKTSIENNIKNIENSIKRQDDYNKNSILMQINPYSEQQAYVYYYVDTDYKIVPELKYQNIDLTSRIIRYYQSLAQSGKLYNYIKSKLSFDIDERYLKEIIYLDTEDENGMIMIKVLNNDKDVCNEIISLVKEYFDQEQAIIKKLIGEHKLNIVEDNIITTVDLQLEKTQNENQQLLNDYKDSLTTEQTKLKDLVKPIKYIMNTSKIAQSAIKFSIFGLMAGTFLICIVLSFAYLLSDKLMSEKQVNQRYNLVVLGRLSQYKKRLMGLVDKWLISLEGNRVLKTENEEAEEIKRIAANIKNITKQSSNQIRNILITGTVNDDKIQNICDKISASMSKESYHLSFGGNINCNAGTIELLAVCNDVIIIEDLKNSSNTDVSNEIKNIHDIGKDILGIILV